MSTRRAKIKISRKLAVPWEESRDKSLKDWGVARHYLRMALQEGGLDEFLDCLKEVSQAVGVSKLAQKSGLTRQAIYQMLSGKGNPEARSLWRLVEALKLRFDLVEEKKAA